MAIRDFKNLVAELEHEVTVLQGEIRKREEIINKLRDLEGLSTVSKPSVGGKKRGRKPGMKAKAVATKKMPAKRGPKPKFQMKRGRPAVRKQAGPKTADVMAEILARVGQPITVDELCDKFHKQYPNLGGVKYRSVISSIITRDNRFAKKGSKVVLKG